MARKNTRKAANDNFITAESQLRAMERLWQDMVALEASLGVVAHYRPQEKKQWLGWRQHKMSSLKRIIINKLDDIKTGQGI